ncbi:MAG: hypothetical protein KGL39_56050 [Patescibacteria group bacterium]|nr:hypothetical protein [Patescibacteria group bacterium]
MAITHKVIMHWFVRGRVPVSYIATHVGTSRVYIESVIREHITGHKVRRYKRRKSANPDPQMTIAEVYGEIKV